MSSEQLGAAQNVLKGNLGGAWDINKGYQDAYTDLGIGRRFGGASMAFSLRDIGAMNGSVVRVRREPYDTSATETQDETDFSANQVQSGALEDWVNGKLENTLPADVNYALGLESARYFNGTNSGVVTSSISGLVNATGSIETSFALFEKNGAIVSFEDSSAGSDNMTIQTDASGYLTILHRTGGGSTNILAKLQTLVLDDGTLHTVRWNMTSSGSQVILDGKDVTSEMTFTIGTASTVKWVSDLNDPDVLSIGYRAESSPDGFATGVVVNTTIFGTDNATPLANYLGYGSSNYWNDTIGSLNATESNITQTWEQAQGAAAAYSLRKVKDNYTGNAVRIRRETDDVEVDVAFDSDGKVSASSAITNTTEEDGEIGSTSETTLGSFLSETTNVSKSYDHSQDPTSAQKVYVTVGRFGSSNPVLYDGNTNSDSLPAIPGGARYASKWTATNAAYGFKVGDAYNGATYDIEFDILQKTGAEDVRFANTNFMELYPASNIIEGSLGSGQTFTTRDSWVHFKMRLRTGEGNNGSFLIRSNDTSVQTTWYIANLTMTPTVDSSAFVHTWYDQAGSNNAVQDTADSQPKIADDGALLDGIKFNADVGGGNPDFLQVATRLGVTTDHMVSVVFNGYQTDTSLFGSFLNTRNGNAGFQYGIASTNKVQAFFYAGAGNNANSSSDFVLSNNSAKRLVTFDKDGDTLTGFGNATTNGISISNAVNTPSTTVTNIGVGGNVGDTTALGLRANINELIVYETDQASNRFKIESNINNYYGLYNDANAFSANAQVDGTGSTVSNASKDGGTLTLSSASGNNYLYFQLTETVPATSGDIFISFNYESSNDSVTLNNVKLRDDADNAKSGDLVDSGGSAITIQKNGFYSGKLASANLTATGTRLAFLTNQTTDGYTFTISNLRYSRIARDGLVETWYDQSGNGFDLKSQSADTQPFIVNNGGFTGGVYSPSRLNNSTKQYLEISDPDFDSTNITSSKFGWLAVMANMEENDGSDAGGVILGNTRNTQSFPAGSISLTLSDTNPNGRMFVTNLKTSSTGDFIGAVDNDDLFTSETIGTAVVDGSSLSTFLNGTTGSGTFTGLTLTSDVHFKIFQSSDAGNNPYYQNAAQGFIKELMFIQGDIIDDIETIRNEVNNHYNIF